MDNLTFIMAVEGDGLKDMSAEEYIDGMANLISGGIMRNLQGSWQRAAQALVDGGLIDQRGNVLAYPEPV